MVRGPTEVVFQVRLPPGPLAGLTEAAPAIRIVCTPVSMNGARYPARYLFSAAGPGADAAALKHALSSYADDVRIVREAADAVDAMATLNETMRRALDGTLGEATVGLGPDLVHRAALIRGGWLHASVLVPDEGPVEQAVARLSQMLKERGIDARLDRIAPYVSERTPLGTYEDSLTPKQAEILRVALALGLYDTPRRCTLDTLAEIFGISKAAAHNRMKGAERKILSRYFE